MNMAFALPSPRFSLRSLGPRLTTRKAPATCGELVMGAIGGREFLVNCPIDLFSRASVLADGRAGLNLHSAESFGKVADAITLLSDDMAFDLAHEVRVVTAIPRGKGMGSTSADITAAADALFRSGGIDIPPQTLARLIALIQPSPCTHLPGISQVDPLSGDVLDRMPAPAGLRVLVVDGGGAAAGTQSIDRERAAKVYRKHGHRIEGALRLLKGSLVARNAAGIAQAATISAELNQKIAPKPAFDPLLRRVTEAGALGLCCAHRGTVLGILYRAQAGLGDLLARVVEWEFGTDLPILGDHEIIGGGCRTT